MSDPNALHVFVSYAVEDAKWAKKLVDRLEATNLSCWIAPRDIHHDRDYPTQIMDAICGSDVVLVLISEHANASSFVVKEIERAVSRNIPVLPVMLTKVEPSPALELLVSASQRIDAWNTEAWMDEVIDSIQFIKGQPAARPDKKKVLLRRGPLLWVATAAVLLLIAVTGLRLIWPPALSVEQFADQVLDAFAERNFSWITSRTSPKIRANNSEEWLQAQLAQTRDAQPVGQRERTTIEATTSTFIPPQMIGGQFELRRYSTQIGSKRFCESVWIESDGGEWLVAGLTSTPAPESGCLMPDEIASAEPAAREFLEVVDSGDFDRIQDTMLIGEAANYPRDMIRQQLRSFAEFASTANASGQPSRFIGSAALTLLPGIPRTGQFVVFRFGLDSVLGTYHQDIWLERDDSNRWLVVSFFVIPPGAGS